MQKKTTAPWPSRQPGCSGPGLTEKAGGKGEKVRQELTSRMATCGLCTSDAESSCIPASQGLLVRVALPCCRRTRRRVERYNAVVTQRADKWQAQRSSLSQNPAYSPTCSFSFLFRIGGASPTICRVKFVPKYDSLYFSVLLICG